MKSKYLLIALVSLSFSTSVLAQSPIEKAATINTTHTNRISSVELKTGPLADFYELVAQHQLIKNYSEIGQEAKQDAKQEIAEKVSKGTLQQRPLEASSKIDLTLVINANTLEAIKP